MNTAYILQPGKLGDLIVTTPIANYYHNNGYKIVWLLFENFSSFFNAIEYVEVKTFSNVKMDNSKYFSNKRLNFSDKESIASSYNFFTNALKFAEETVKKDDLFLDICWGFPGSPNNSKNLIYQFNIKNKNWIDMRYSLAKVPLKERWNFSWKRNEKKEDDLLKFIQDFSYKKYGSKEFSINHNYKENIRKVNLKNEIVFSYIKGYEIYDWYKVLLEAKEISCVDSSLCNFVEVLPELKEKKKYYLGSEEPHYFEFMRNILLNNWHDSANKQIISDYIGKI